MLRTDIRPRISADRRGKITTGTKSEKGFPKSLDYFDVQKFPELIDAYGKAPDKLIVYVPSNNIEDFYRTEYHLYGGNQTKKRTCDGTTCLHHIDETIDGISYKAGQETECICKNLPDDSKETCKGYMSLKVFIADMKGVVINPICYFFESHSTNTADNLYSELQKAWRLLNGRLVGIPFLLSVNMISGKDAKQKFPIWSLQTLGTVRQITEMADRAAIPTLDNMGRQIDLTAETPVIQEAKALNEAYATNDQVQALRTKALKVAGKMTEQDKEDFKKVISKPMTITAFQDWETKILEIK
jgi:hypothetical protein